MKGRTWTHEETDYLKENYGTVPLQSLADHLNRSKASILNKRQKFHLGAFLDAGDYITWHQLLLALGIEGGSGYMNKSWIENRGCPVRYKTVGNNKFKVINIDDFWEWAEKNREFVDLTKMEPLILGKEPDWVPEARKAQWAKKLNYRSTPWTGADDDKLKQMINEYRYTYEEMSKELGRTCGAIQRRCVDLGIKGRPVKACNTNLWTESELQILAAGINDMLPYEIIAERLPGRSVKSLRGLIYRMYKTEDINKAAAILNGGKWGDNRPDRKITDRTLNTDERIQVRSDMTKFVLLLKGRICEHYESNDYWQRLICQHWNDGCEAGEDNCDECTSFIRLRPQYCKRCGRTFYEHESNDFCENCRTARKKAAQRKYMVIGQGRKDREDTIAARGEG